MNANKLKKKVIKSEIVLGSEMVFQPKPSHTLLVNTIQ